MNNPYETGESISERDNKNNAEEQSSSKFKKLLSDPYEEELKNKDNLTRTFQTQKRKFLEDKVMIKNTKIKKFLY